MTVAVGCPTAISLARFGPDTTATCDSSTPATSRITSLIRLPVPSSTPLDNDTSVASGGNSSFHADRLTRNVCDGTASTTASAPSRAFAGSEVAVRLAGNEMPGR